MYASVAVNVSSPSLITPTCEIVPVQQLFHSGSWHTYG